MKNSTKILQFLIGLFLATTCFSSLNAQGEGDQIVPEQELDIMIDSISKIVAYYYISEEIGRDMGNFIKSRHEERTYNNLSFQRLGEQLREDLVSISGDLHMSAFYSQRKETPKASMLSRKSDNYGELSNYGYVETKLLEHNIGYLKIAHFTKYMFFEEAKATITKTMSLMENRDALIIDVRGNPGGFEEIVAHVVSYFFDTEPIYLQEYYCRYQDRTRSISTTADIPGKKLPTIPLYVLVDEKSGSAAESFAYLLKHLDRATIIGDTTAGAGNGSNYFRVSDQFQIQIATWETINSVTKTSWEKVGVIPEVVTTSEAAFDKALELAKTAAEAHRSQIIENYEAILSDMEQAIKNHTSALPDEPLINSLTACQQAGLIDEGAINNMGYELIRQDNNPKTAEVVFKANTILFPASANVYDSYAEALALNDKMKEALQNFQKAVDIAIENGDSNLEIFIANLEKTQQQMRD